MSYVKIPVDDAVVKNPLLKEFLKGKHHYHVRECITVDTLLNKKDVDLSDIESYFSNPVEFYDYPVHAQLNSEGSRKGTSRCGSIFYTGKNKKILEITLEYNGRLFIKDTSALLYLDPYNENAALNIWHIEKK